MSRHGVWLPPQARGIGVLAVLVFSGIDPVADRLTWFLETFPVMIALPLLALTYRRFPLTPLAYHLIALHALVLIWGGYYTYAENPLFDWLQERYDLARNYYDRLGHVVQGFVPAILVREILVRLVGNLKHLYLRRRDFGRALACSERILLLVPTAPVELRDRGLIYEQLECYDAARSDLERFLELAPEDESVPAVKARIVALAGKVPRLH